MHHSHRTLGKLVHSSQHRVAGGGAKNAEAYRDEDGLSCLRLKGRRGPGTGSISSKRPTPPSSPLPISSAQSSQPLTKSFAWLPLFLPRGVILIKSLLRFPLALALLTEEPRLDPQTTVDKSNCRACETRPVKMTTLPETIPNES